MNRIAWIAAGFLMACLFTGCSTGGDRRSEERPVLSATSQSGDRLDLYAGTSEVCKSAQLLRAVYHYSKEPNPKRERQLDGTSVEGCYTIRDGVVFLIFVDGDQFMLPLELFTGKPSGSNRPTGHTVDI